MKWKLQCSSFDSERDKLRDKRYDNLKSDTLIPVKDSRRKSVDTKRSPVCKDYGFFKFKSYANTPSFFSKKVSYFKFKN